MKHTALSIIAALALALGGCATTGVTGTSNTPTNHTISQLFDRYVNLINVREGLSAAASLNGFFAVLRAACNEGGAQCRDACARREDAHNYVDHWNQLASYRFPIAGGSQTIAISWDADIDPICASHGHP